MVVALQPPPHPPQATPIRGPIRNCKSLVFRKFPCQEAYLIL